MLCPDCRAECASNAVFCPNCQADLSVPSTSLVPVQTHRLPTVLYNPQLPRVAAGVGALAIGVGLELLRRGLLKRAVQAARPASGQLPVVSPRAIRELFGSSDNKSTRPPKGYEVHETVIYMSRVIRRKG